jgi:hypothetical protein
MHPPSIDTHTHDNINVYHIGTCLDGLGEQKTKNITDPRITPAKFRTHYPTNTCQEPYRYANPLGFFLQLPSLVTCERNRMDKR